MLSFLKTVFGNDITISEHVYPSGAPSYLHDMYELKLLSWGENKCLILSPRDSEWKLPMLKKHLKKLQSMSELPCALCLERLTSVQRQNLLADKIPFVAISQQVYFPFWGSSFFERFKASANTKKKMAPGTQEVFLYLYYLEGEEPVNMTHICKELSLSKATCTRAIDDLLASGLIEVRKEGTNKWISRAYDKTKFLSKGYERLKSPVDRIIYLKSVPEIEPQFLSGMRALSEETMIGSNENDGAIALSKKDATAIPKDLICNKQFFDDFGGAIVEVWSYNPATFAENGHVDDISLIMSLEDERDERVQMCLDELRRKHGLPVAEDE
jgi:predicted DNA-binding transcriptional regulator